MSNSITTIETEPSSSIRSTLNSFHVSPRRFQILETSPPKTPAVAPRDLFILDSCFNPPTVAHLSLAVSAINAPTPQFSAERRLLLLFCTNGNEKARSPAGFEQRIEMIRILVEEIRTAYPSSKNIAIDICVTKETIYVDKSAAIEALSKDELASMYGCDSESIGKLRHVYLLGFDNFARILQPHFYPNSTPPFSALAPLFNNSHQLLCSTRPEIATLDENQSVDIEDVQKAEMEDLISSNEANGFQKNWATQVSLSRALKEAAGVSSTAVRKAAKAGDGSIVHKMCPVKVANYVLSNSLYILDDRGLK